MSIRRTKIAAVIVWGMIPLALVSGLPATGCICANGQFRLFCPGALGQFTAAAKSKVNAESDALAETCPYCSGLASNADDEVRPCCTNANGERIPCRKCCQVVKQSLATIATHVAPPTSEMLVVALLPPAVDVSLVVLPTISKHVEQIDTGPPVDRVIVLRCLLI